MLDKVFFKVLDVWDYGWDNQLNTVPPEKVTIATLLAMKLYRSKKVIAHCIQPHEPYICLSKLGFKPIYAFDNVRSTRVNIVVSLMSRLLTYLRRKKKVSQKLYYKLRWYLQMGFGNIHIDLALGRKILLLSYVCNLLYAPISTKKLLERLRNIRVVITADHGELLGEYNMYGHRASLYCKELIEVPWLEIDL